MDKAMADESWAEWVEALRGPGGDPVLVRVADIEHRPVGWLWPGRVPSAKLTLVAGDPGLGKSLLALDIAARVTTGRPWPDAEESPIANCRVPIEEDGGAGGAGESARPIEDGASATPAPQSAIGNRKSAIQERSSPGNVILLSAEDDVADTIRPRLEAAGGDAARVVVLDAVRRLDRWRAAEEPFSLGADLGALDRAIARTGGVSLVIIDPLSAYLGRADSHRNSEVRSLLGPLKKLAERRGVAVLGVTHLNKNAATSVLYRATGSLAFVAAARAVWAVARDPERPGRHLLLPVKCNLAGGVTGLAFSIQDAPGRPGTPILVWEREPVLLGAEEALAHAAPASREALSERQQAAAWLRELLAAGPVRVEEVKRRANAAGFSLPTVRRAKASLCVEIHPEGYGKAWSWRLGSQSRPAGPSVDQPGPSVDQPQGVINTGHVDQH